MTVQAPTLVTSLQELCIRVAAANFESSPSFGRLNDKHVKRIINILPLDLPLELIGTLIQDEDYWKRRCHARWKNLEVSAHGNSYRQLYFERNLQDVVEQYDPAITSESDLRRCMAYSRRFVQSLHIRQLPSHMDLSILFECMVNVPCALTVHYSLSNVGMEYDRSLFGMKLTDCRALAKALEVNETLTYLDLSNNLLDDDKVRMLASGLIENISVTHLNLSHNKVADRGVRALAKVLDTRSVISILELQDNLIHTEGAKSLARALKNNQALTALNLRLNRLGDEGVKAVCESLRANQSLTKLSIASNAGGKAAATALASLIRLNNTITELDASCNSGFGQSECEQLRRAVENNTGLMRVDIRQCGASAADEYAITEALRMRHEARQTKKG